MGNMAYLLNQARSGRPDLAAMNLGVMGYSPMAMHVFARYSHHAGWKYSEAELATYYMAGKQEAAEEGEDDY